MRRRGAGRRHVTVSRHSQCRCGIWVAFFIWVAFCIWVAFFSRWQRYRCAGREYVSKTHWRGKDAEVLALSYTLKEF